MIELMRSEADSFFGKTRMFGKNMKGWRKGIGDR